MYRICIAPFTVASTSYIIGPQSMANDYGIQTVEEAILYTSARPRPEPGSGVMPERDDVDEWIEEAKRLGIRTIICLLDDQSQLHRYYDGLNLHSWGLLGYYCDRGFEVCYFRTVDYHPVPERTKKMACAAFRRSAKPVVLQDSGGVDRVGAVAKFISREGW